MAILSNISFTSGMEEKISRFSAQTACNVLPQHIDCFLSIKKTSQIVRNDCTNIQQHALTKRIINMRKKKEIQIIAKGRGRVMLAAQFPELPLLLEYAFGDHNTHLCSGGGLESHPRLTDGTLYRTADNYTTMKSARKLLLLLAPDSFSISLKVLVTTILWITELVQLKQCAIIMVKVLMQMWLCVCHQEQEFLT